MMKNQKPTDARMDACVQELQDVIFRRGLTDDLPYVCMYLLSGYSLNEYAANEEDAEEAEKVKVNDFRLHYGWPPEAR